MADDSGDKKHSASDQRRRKAREEGQVVKSQDLASAALLIVALLVLRWRGPAVAESLAVILTESIKSNGPQVMNNQHASHVLGRMATDCAWQAVPIMLMMFVAAILGNILQTGPLLVTSKIVPDINHLNPFTGVQRMFSLSSFMRLAFGLMKVGIVSAVAYYAVMQWYEIVLSMSELALPVLASTLFRCCVDTGLWIGGALLVLAILEYAYQWWKYEQDLSMSDQEMRDEIKESQGDPQMAMRRKMIQQKMAMARISKEVPKADAVITNPTELAIAIRFDPKTMPAPVVVAKGAGVIAQRIRRLALEHEVPIVERKPLAQILYKTTDVGSVVPLEQYKAVAEVLRYVYQLKGRPLPNLAA